MGDIPFIISILKTVLLLTIAVGGVVVFRELIPMARGKAAPVAKPREAAAKDEA